MAERSRTTTQALPGHRSAAANGVGDDRAVFAEPAPSLRRSRNLPGAVLGVLVVVVCALVVASLASSAGNRTDVLVVIRPVPAGTRITAADLGTSGVAAGHLVSGVPASDAGGVVGQVATHDLVPGTLLVRSEMAATTPMPAGQAIVGLSVKDGDLPAGLAPEDHAEVVSTPASTSSSSSPAVPADPVLVGDATVQSVAAGPDGQSTLVSLIVPANSAASVAAANAAGSVSLVMVGG